MSAASASIFRSGSQSDTTSTGATWMSRKRSHLPYQPDPIRPTRGRSAAEEVEARPGAAARARPAELERKKRRRFMATLPFLIDHSEGRGSFQLTAPLDSLRANRLTAEATARAAARATSVGADSIAARACSYAAEARPASCSRTASP